MTPKIALIRCSDPAAIPLADEDIRSASAVLLSEEPSYFSEQDLAPFVDSLEEPVVLTRKPPQASPLAALLEALPPELGLLARRWDRENAVLLPRNELAEKPGSVPGFLSRRLLAGQRIRLASLEPETIPSSDPPTLRQPPRHASPWSAALISGVVQRVSPQPASAPDAVAFEAGLLLIHNQDDAAHERAQSIEQRGVHRAGDYWHAVIHRREPDYGNAKYWFRSVGRHPIFAPLRSEAAALTAGLAATVNSEPLRRLAAATEWDPFGFVDLCQACERGEAADLELAARRIQEVEMQLLLRQTWRDAHG